MNGESKKKKKIGNGEGGSYGEQCIETERV